MLLLLYKTFPSLKLTLSDYTDFGRSVMTELSIEDPELRQSSECGDLAPVTVTRYLAGSL